MKLPAGPALDAINPMRALDDSVQPFTDPDWLYEIKFDGYRTLAQIDDGEVVLRTKNGADCTRWFPEVAELLATLPAGGRHVLDAEVCVLDDLGRSHFDRLHDRARKRRWHAGADPVTLMAFDLIVEGGKSLMGLPLVNRKKRLSKLLASTPKTSVLVVGDFPAEAALFREFVVELKLEGFMAKRRAGTYQPGPQRSADWLKIKRKGAVPPERFKRT